MSIRIKVRGFRGAERADIEINSIGLLAGVNFAGKSSVCQAVAAAVCSQPIPFFNSARPDKPRYTKTDAKEMLRGGMSKGGVSIELEGKEVAAVAWPALTCSGTGAVQCSLVAAGLVVPMDMDDGDRQKFFAGLLKADPTLVDLEAALKEAIPALAEEDYKDALGKVLTMVETNGWDVAHRHFKESGAKRKGAWEERAGEAFGAKKAVGWLPPGWRKDLDDQTLEELGTACTQAQAAVEQAVAAVATDAAQLAQLSEQANGEAAAWNALQEARTAQDAALAERGARVAQVKAITVPTALPCPHCGGLVDVVEGKHLSLRQSSAKAKDIEAAQKALDAAKVLAAGAEAALTTAQSVYNSAKGAHEARKGATERLQAAKKKTGSQDAVDVARDYLAGVLKDKDMVERRDTCEVLAEQIQANQKLVDILAPEGLRRQKLQKALAATNKRLAELSSAAEFATVTIDDALEILYGGRKFFLLSQSEQFRVRSVIQLYVAQQDGSPLVIYDAADQLDQGGRNGLFAMMQSVPEKSFLVAMTFSNQKYVPDLAKAGIGVSVWMNEGVATPL